MKPYLKLAARHWKKIVGVAVALGLMYRQGLSAQDAVAKALEILAALAGLV
jgi:hypothetical protein